MTAEQFLVVLRYKVLSIEDISQYSVEIEESKATHLAESRAESASELDIEVCVKSEEIPSDGTEISCHTGVLSPGQIPLNPVPSSNHSSTTDTASSSSPVTIEKSSWA